MLRNNKLINQNKNKKLDFYLIGFLLLLVFYLGNFSQLKDGIIEYNSSNAEFLILVNLLLYNLKFKKQIFFLKTLLLNDFFLVYLFTLFILIFFRIDFLKESRNFIQILLTYLLVFQVSIIMYSIGIVLLIKYFSNYFTFVLLLCFLVFLRNNGRIYFFEHDTNLRLGGLFFFGTTAIISGFCILINVILYSLKIERVFTLCKIVFSLVILFATDTRMVIFITFICSLMIVFWKHKKVILISALGLSVIYIVLDNLLKNDYIKNAETDLEFRSFIWDASILKIREQFWVGYGVENPFKNINIANVDSLQDPHSAYISIFLRQGFFAAISLFVFYYKKFISNISIFSIFLIFFFLSVIVGTEIFLGGLTYLNFMFNITLFGLILHPDSKKIKSKENLLIIKN